MYQEPIIFDAEFALQQFSGNQPLLLKMLKKFTEQYAQFEPVLRNHLDGTDMDVIKQQIHTLKGVSGNLGMNALHQASREFETELKNQPAQLANPTNYLHVISKTLASITEYDAANQQQESTVAKQEEVCPQTRQNLLMALKRNEFLSPTKLDDFIDNCGLTDQQQQVLRGAIDDLDYQTAINLLE
ncbi:MAG: HPt (histidine-containing phosphotransfer) domain-containing protein [Paraglaciecola sp.]|jgi:HPt (histidine-containing phosphotransfer) domain-containing protein